MNMYDFSIGCNGIGCIYLNDQFMRRRLSDASEASRRLSDAYEPSRRLSDAYEPSHRLSDAYDHNLKKKFNIVIFGRFKRKNPRAIGSNRQIFDRNVVV